MKIIFEDADAFEWENAHEGLIPGDIIQKAKDDPSDVASRVAEVIDAKAVSYTHLTLPTT